MPALTASSLTRLQFSVVPDDVVGGAVMSERRFLLVFKLGDDPLRQDLSQLHAPLIERVDAPDRALREDTVFVKRNQLSEALRSQFFGEDDVRRPISLKHPMRYKPVGRTLRLHLLSRFAERQGLGLCTHVRNQQVVVPADDVEWFAKCDEVTRNEPCALVDQLVKRMLSVRAWLAPVNWTRIAIDGSAIQLDVLAV